MVNTSPNRKIKRLFWDIETSPNVGLFWRAGFDQNISHESIINERKIITIAWKWEGVKKVEVVTWDKNQDDKKMLGVFLEAAKEADELVAHYGDRFDIPWFRTRCLIQGFDPLPAFKTIDTKAWASKNFYFNSNKLDYIGSVLGEGRKIHTDYDLWKDIVLKNCPKALAKMCQYNAGDVELLEKVYLRIAPFIKVKTHAGVMSGGEKWTCPRDGSRNVSLSKRRVTSAGTVQYQMKCNDCKSYFTISETVYKQFLSETKKKEVKDTPYRRYDSLPRRGTAKVSIELK